MYGERLCVCRWEGICIRAPQKLKASATGLRRVFFVSSLAQKKTDLLCCKLTMTEVDRRRVQAKGLRRN
jgi:hypothetical protein